MQVVDLDHTGDLRQGLLRLVGVHARRRVLPEDGQHLAAEHHGADGHE